MIAPLPVARVVRLPANLTEGAAGAAGSCRENLARWYGVPYVVDGQDGVTHLHTAVCYPPPPER